MSTTRATFTLDSEAFAFLMAAGGENRSAFISDLLKREKQRSLAAAIAQANSEEMDDIEYQDELAVWDKTLSDGLKSDV